jgi:hypothetical protein
MQGFQHLGTGPQLVKLHAGRGGNRAKWHSDCRLTARGAGTYGSHAQNRDSKLVDALVAWRKLQQLLTRSGHDGK